MVWVQADLGRITPLQHIGLWMFYKDGRAHSHVRVEVSVSGAFNGEHVLLYKCSNFADCGPEKKDGRIVAAYKVGARYVRIYVGKSSVDLTVRFLRVSVASADGKGCVPCPLGTTFDGAAASECRVCDSAEERGGMLMRVEDSVIGCGTVGVCDGGRGRSFMGVCMRYFGHGLWEKGDAPPPLPGAGARNRDGSVAWEEAEVECGKWGGALAKVDERAKGEFYLHA
jgi:hypothetical protein